MRRLTMSGISAVGTFLGSTGLVGQYGRMLVESLAAPFEPDKYHDTYRDNLQKLIDAKIKGQDIVQPPAQEPAKVIDIMEALKQSLLISKKPATSATEIAPAEASVAKKRGSKRAPG